MTGSKPVTHPIPHPMNMGLFPLLGMFVPISEAFISGLYPEIAKAPMVPPLVPVCPCCAYSVRPAAQPRYPSMTMRYLTIALAVFLTACNEMQPTPVAPSAIVPAAPSVGPTLPRNTTFDVTLANGTEASQTFAGNTWMGFLSVQPLTGAQITIPTRVTLDCGNGARQDLPPGVGNGLQVTCYFTQPGTSTVRASVDSANGATTAAELPVRVLPQPPDTTPAAVDITFALAPGGHEWVFTPTTTGRIVSLSWDFGDGHTLTTGPGQVVRHSFSGHGVFVVTATPRLEDGSTRAPGRVEILN